MKLYGSAMNDACYIPQKLLTQNVPCISLAEFVFACCSCASAVCCLSWLSHASLETASLACAILHLRLSS